MKKLSIYLIFLFLIPISCGEKWIEKPDKLITEKTMIDMLVDLHVANSMLTTRQYKNADSLKFESKDFYYSMLNKYEVADTLFEKSLLYYASYSKDYEKMYAKVLDKLNLMEQEYLRIEDEPVDIGN